jgi:glutamate racemase
LIDTHCRPLREAAVDTVVLGCTHYPFVQTTLQAALGPGVQIVDTAAAVARHAATLLGASAETPQTVHDAGEILLETTGDAAQLERFARSWLAFDCAAIAAPRGL